MKVQKKYSSLIYGYLQVAEVTIVYYQKKSPKGLWDENITLIDDSHDPIQQGIMIEG